VLNTTRDEGERRRKYREFVSGMLGDKEAMRGEMDRRRVYGSKDFMERVTKRYSVEAVIESSPFLLFLRQETGGISTPCVDLPKDHESQIWYLF
jgi:hypothetical protein